MKKHPVDPNTLCEILDYDASSGKMFWKKRSSKFFDSDGMCKYWNERYAGKEAMTSKRGKGYLSGSIFSVTYRAHRVAWAVQTGCWPDGEIDHINGNTSDNRFSNLRDVSRYENMKNVKKPSTNKSGTIGVWFDRRRSKWRSCIKLQNKTMHIGSFDDIFDAIDARKSAEIMFGFHENHGR